MNMKTMAFLALLSLYIFDLIRLHKKINDRNTQIKKLKVEITALQAMLYNTIFSGRNTPKEQPDNQDLAKIEKELRGKYTLLGAYFDDIFPRLYREIKQKQGTIEHTISNVPEEVTLYVLLFLQITERLKYSGMYVYRGMLNMKGGDMYALWKELLEKLEHYNYFSPFAAEQLRNEMTAWIKTNG